MDDRQDTRLLIMIARSDAALDELITGLLDAGIRGATVVDSQGLGSILRQDMPIFAGLAALLPQYTGNRVVLSLTSEDVIESMKRFVDGMREQDKPIAIVVPVIDSFGHTST